MDRQDELIGDAFKKSPDPFNSPPKGRFLAAIGELDVLVK